MESRQLTPILQATIRGDMPCCGAMEERKKRKEGRASRKTDWSVHADKLTGFHREGEALGFPLPS